MSEDALRGAAMGEWDDLEGVRDSLGAALDKFYWTEAAAIRERLVDRVADSATAMPVASAKQLLSAFRRKRRFADARRLAEALIEAGTDDFAVAREYAQASIDDGELLAARAFLTDLVARDDSLDADRIEARGLIGRVHKQLFINAAKQNGSAREQNLVKSIRAYQ
ncbi:MAG: hypothetical protein JNK04_19610, partial [Myxococcales bacterium]|nr:hypothetical protein [Myxococcales bacterium]